jgi:F-type H+-transporting ATPase subunit c
MIGICALELMVAGIQAYVFALLTSLYINDAENRPESSINQSDFPKEFVMEMEAAKLIGAGLAAIGAGMAAIGVGNVFGSFLESALRNPGAADGQQGRLFIGFAAAELLGLLAFVVAMILIFVA